MASGYKDIAATTYDTLRFYWVESTQDKVNNQTTISWELQLISGQYGAIYSNPEKPWKVTVNGTAYTGKSTVAIGNNTSKTLGSGKTTISHNADGTKTFSYSFEQAFDISFNGWVGTVSGSGEGTLTRIARAATFVSVDSFTDEGFPRFTFSNPAGNTLSSLVACVSIDGSKDDIPYREIPKTATEYTFTDLTEAQRKAFRKAADGGKDSIPVKYFMYSYIDGVQSGGDGRTATFSVINAEPTLNPVVYATDAKTKELTGDSSGNTLIKHKSSVYVGYGQEAKKEATITKYYCRNGSQRLGGVSYGNLSAVDSGEFVFSIVDSRDKVADATINKTIVDYIPISCNLNTKVELAGEQNANIELTVTGSYFDGSFGAVKNSLAVEFRIKENNGAWGSWQTIPSSGHTFHDGTFTTQATATGLNYQSTYTVQARATDAFAVPVSSLEVTVKLIPVFDWGENDFNFNVPVSVKGVEQDFIVESGTKDIWHYEKWNSGIMKCWGTYTHSTALSSSWGSLYFSNTMIPRQNYPYPFKAKPTEIVTAQSGDYAAWLYNETQGVNGAWASGIYGLCTPIQKTDTQTFYISYMVIGLWK
jgi:hypothetical protein